MPATEPMVAALPERQPLLAPILASNSLALLYGPRGLGKTFVALGIAWAAAAGGSFLGWQASRPHKVLYIDGEMAAVDIRDRLRLLGSAPPTLDFLIADLGNQSLPDLGYYEGQGRLQRPWGNPDLVVLDNLSNSASPKSATRVRSLAGGYKLQCLEVRCALLPASIVTRIATSAGSARRGRCRRTTS